MKNVNKIADEIRPPTDGVEMARPSEIDAPCSPAMEIGGDLAPQPKDWALGTHR